MPPLLYSEIKKINAILQIYTSGGDIYDASHKLLITCYYYYYYY